jgi:hypothetical protein
MPQSSPFQASPLMQILSATQSKFLITKLPIFKSRKIMLYLLPGTGHYQN